MSIEQPLRSISEILSLMEVPSNDMETQNTYLKHFHQQSNWDCGPMSLWMVLYDIMQASGKSVDYSEFLSSFQADISQGLWSIDMAYILKRYNVNFVFYTSCTKPSFEAYSAFSFYNSSTNEEIIRIRSLFAKAIENNIHILNIKLSLSILKKVVCLKGIVAIVIVDVHELNHSLFYSCCASSFVGHYIILTYYDEQKDVFYVKDPGSYKKTRYISSKRIETARSMPGTDDDLFLISINH
ncbi:hypothetical protein WA158_007665 [Blastocystis sp. Blastoise]